MPEKTSYAPGTPSWVDLATPDMEVAIAFYCPLLGWTVAPGDGGYRMFELRGRAAAGAAPIRTPGHPPAWTTYVTVADAGGAAARIREAGGSVLVEPMDVMAAGRMALFSDPTGAVAALWEPRDHVGAGIVNEPGALCWNELTCRDPDAAKAFYRDVFGWSAADGTPGGQPYTTFSLGDAPVAGMIVMDERWPVRLPAYWAIYFAVADPDAAAEHARSLGGTVTVEPFDTPAGRMAVLADPHGAAFSVIRLG